MSTRKLLAGVIGGLLTLTAAMTGEFSFGDSGGPVAATRSAGTPVQLAAYGSDAATSAATDVASGAVSAAAPPYESLFANLPSLPPLLLGLNIPGVEDVFDNVTGVLPWDYAVGGTLGNSGGLGIQAWDPSNPVFTFVAESIGTTGQPWPGVASLIGMETLLGGFTNTESYANTFDPTNTTCIICDTFTLLGPLDTQLFSWTSDIPLGGLPQLELTTPLGSFGPDLGDAFDYSPLANGLVSDPTTLLSAIASDPASLTTELTTLTPTISADLTALSGQLGANLAADVPALLAGVIP
jgi:hypothetical protein